MNKMQPLMSYDQYVSNLYGREDVWADILPQFNQSLLKEDYERYVIMYEEMANTLNQTLSTTIAVTRYEEGGIPQSVVIDGALLVLFFIFIITAIRCRGRGK